MRKLIAIALMIVLLFSYIGCTRAGQPPRRPETGRQHEPITPELQADEVEENINGIDVRQDMELTEQAQEADTTELNVLITQNQVDQHREELRQGQMVSFGNSPANSSEQTNLPEVEVVREFATTVPQNITKDIRYDKYPVSFDYALVIQDDVAIRRSPEPGGDQLSTGKRYEKLNLLQEVKGQVLGDGSSDKWYRVFWKNDDQAHHGFVFGGGVEPRTFQFDKMLAAVTALKEEVDGGQTAFIFNYKNRNGLPPAYDGQNRDKNNNARSQSAPAYTQPDLDSEFIYFPDGTLVTIMAENEPFYRVRSLQFAGEYWVPKEYVTFWNSIETLTQAIVVDRRNQNQATFEYGPQGWTMISYTYCTTGFDGPYSLETPLGNYMAIERREQFYYAVEGGDEIAGYAPYAIRFSAGGYIHGVPVAYQEENGERVDPGLKEYLYTIGTIPRSHKCVRNYTSHAKFLYDWAQVGSCAVIVIE